MIVVLAGIDLLVAVAPKVLIVRAGAFVLLLHGLVIAGITGVERQQRCEYIQWDIQWDLLALARALPARVQGWQPVVGAPIIPIIDVWYCIHQ